MDVLEEVLPVILVVLGVGAFITLLAFTAAFFVSIGVWPIVAWGWFTVFVLVGGFSAIAAGQ